MANETERKRGFPYISLNVWAELRRAFSRNLPSKVDIRYLQSVLNTSEKNARNILPQLRTVGLVDENGVPLDLAKRFRMDTDYVEAMKEIVDQVYPTQLRELYPGPEEDATAVTNWFMRETSGGQIGSAAQARFYLTLVSGALPTAERAAKKAPGASGPAAARPTTAPKPAPQAANVKAAAPEPKNAQATSGDSRQTTTGPDLHLDIQIHIDAAATVEQIDAVFASMAKHIYRNA